MSSRLTAAELRRVQAFLDAALDREEHGTPSNDARTLQQQFWTEMRAHLRNNAMYAGLEHFDQLAEDVVDPKAGSVLRGNGVGSSGGQRSKFYRSSRACACRVSSAVVP
ncbi:hypothetical protein PI124_g17141 [Phytophthora idaei]|nr:hypothetical protein PI125_g18446 [Phytophthora idaei]KAG3137858.1 hypothetical protein PI126_g17178 [Phytophthora idaei]KAG3237879.1 hypothetical protein PI124_g17141 [Phytophthora idaei]